MRRKMRKERVARGYSEAQRAEMWERWRRGESLKAIGRVFGKEGGSVFGQLAPYGGIRHRRSVARSIVTEVAAPIAQPRPRSESGVEHGV